MGKRRTGYIVDLADPASLQSWAEILEVSAPLLTEAATTARATPAIDPLIQQVLDAPVPTRYQPRLLDADEYEALVLPSL